MKDKFNLTSQLLGFIFINRAGIGYGVIAAIISWLRGRQNKKSLKLCFFDALLCSFIAFSVQDLLVCVDVSTNIAYFSSAVIGYMGADYLSISIRWAIKWKKINANIEIKYDK